MARPVWKGHIAFGLVSIPVQLYPAQKRTDLQLHMLDSRNHARIRYERVNAETGAEVPWDSIVKGYEYSDGNYVVLSEDELKQAAPEATKTIDVSAFVKLSEISPLFFDTPYYIEPAKGGEKGYSLLRQVLEDTGLVGIARVVIRTRQYIAAVMVMNRMLVLELLRYSQEVRPAEDLTIPDAKSDTKVSAAELKMAKSLVQTMVTEWNPKSYHDEYRDELLKWIDKRVESGDLAHPAEVKREREDEPPAPINFMELLRKSVAKAGGKGPDGDDDGEAAAPSPVAATSRKASSRSSPSRSEPQRAGRSAPARSRGASASPASSSAKSSRPAPRRRKAG